jgi:fibronectin type 3 domain-containing protein
LSGSCFGTQDRAPFDYQPFWITARLAAWRIVAVLVCALSAGTPAFAQTTVIRVNTGGDAYTDFNGNVWSADTGYNTGSAASDPGPVGGTNDPTLYLTTRWDNTPAPELQYSFTVPNGWYEVRLHFADMTLPPSTPGHRVFDAKIEGATVLPRLDIAAEVGHAVALIKTFNVRVTDGQIDIEFLHTSADHPIINALEIISSDKPTTPILTATAASATQVNLTWTASSDDEGVTGYSVERCQGAGCTSFTQIAAPVSTSYSDSGLASTTTYRYRVRAFDNDGNSSSPSSAAVALTPNHGPFSTIRVNSGGPAYTDTAGNTWVADTGFNTGNVANESGTVSGTSDPTLYMTSRWDNSPSPELEYSFNVPLGWYQVNLLFADMYNYPVGHRVFHVQLEGNTVFENLDLIAEAGAYTALTKSSTVKVSDGQLNIRFLHAAADHPVISAIEVFRQTSHDFDAPSTPAGFSALPVSSSRIDLAWSAATDNVGVTGYSLERCQGAGCTNFAQIASQSATTFIDTALTPGTTYRYRVRAGDATSNFSGYAVSNVTTYAGSDSEAPSAPTGLTTSGVTPTQVTLNWDASTDNTAVTAYRVERCQSAACTNFTQIATTTSASLNESGLSPGTVYRYRVRAADAVPNLGAYSSVVSVTTLAGSGDTVPPQPPGSLNATAHSANRINLSWAAAVDNVAVVSYFVERCVGTGCTNPSQIAALGAVLSYEDTGLAGGTTYRYRVRAADADGNFSSYSTVVTTSTLTGNGTAGSVTYHYDSFGRLKQVTVVPN